VYASYLGHSILIDGLLVKLHKRLQEETTLQKQMLHLTGCLDALVSSSSITSLPSFTSTATVPTITTSTTAKATTKAG